MFSQLREKIEALQEQKVTFEATLAEQNAIIESQAFANALMQFTQGEEQAQTNKLLNDVAKRIREIALFQKSVKEIAKNVCVPRSSRHGWSSPIHDDSGGAAGDGPVVMLLLGRNENDDKDENDENGDKDESPLEVEDGAEEDSPQRTCDRNAPGDGPAGFEVERHLTEFLQMSASEAIIASL